ncbi:hypothetical protein BY458DRAFT_506367 [Sporodiniella umbellata]|nr:hypothetical protein BY458DRAFT_506367 [Sporodiniella umbellata]
MCDTNWCTFCDSAINMQSNSLYCSERCLRQDALLHHPLLGYDFSELRGFPHVKSTYPVDTTHRRIQPVSKPSSLASSLSSEDDPFAILYRKSCHAHLLAKYPS